MSELNRQVDFEMRTPTNAARDWLRMNALVR